MSVWKMKSNKCGTGSDELFEFDNPFLKVSLLPEFRQFGETLMGKNFPALDVLEKPDAYVISVDLPGVNKEDIDISSESGVLTIQGERKSNPEELENDVHRNERFFGKFSRRLDFGKYIDQKDISAKYTDGVLKITVKKRTNEEAHKVDIET